MFLFYVKLKKKIFYFAVALFFFVKTVVLIFSIFGKNRINLTIIFSLKGRLFDLKIKLTGKYQKKKINK